MCRYIGKNPNTGQIMLKFFTSAPDVNKYGLKNINTYPDYKIFYVSNDLIKVEEVKKKLHKK
jgi:hypothetical protein